MHAQLFGGMFDGQTVTLPSVPGGPEIITFQGALYYRTSHRSRTGLAIFAFRGTEGSLGKGAAHA